MRRKCWIAMSVAIALVISSPARGESASVMLEKGIYTEETVGDLDAAIEIYREIISNAKANRRYVAEALYRMGICYLKKGEKARAADKLSELVKSYPEQKGLAAKAQAQLAELAPSTATQTGAFGPVVERVLNSPDKTRENSCIDLDTGKLFTLTEELNRSPIAAQPWLAENGIDMGVGDLLGRDEKLAARVVWFQTVLIQIDSQSWDSLPPQAIEAMLAKVKASDTGTKISDVRAITFKKDDRLYTAVFRTIEGARGILQIVGFNPRSALKLRYKLIKPSLETPRMRHFVRLVVAKNGTMTFEGEDTTLEELPLLLEKVADRHQTVLEIAVGSDNMTMGEVDSVRGQVLNLSKRFGFEYTSYIGVHALGSKGSASQMVPQMADLPALLVPTLMRARQEARQTQSRSNLHQIGLAITVYSQYHQGWGPKSLQELVDGGYIGKSGMLILRDPTIAEDLREGETNYVLRREVADGTLKISTSPSEPIVWSDPTKIEDTLSVLYSDGHVRSFELSELPPPADSQKGEVKQWPELIKAMQGR